MEPEKGSSSYAQKPSALLGLLGILGFFFGVWAFSKATPTQETTNSPCPQDHAGKERNRSQKEVPIIPKTMPPPPSEKKTEYKLYTRSPWWKTVAELIGVGAVIWYACITHSMWKEMQTQTGIQRDAGINSERAWVGLDGPIKIDFLNIGPPRLVVMAHYRIRNFGQGPAFKVIPIGWFETNPSLLDAGTRGWCDSATKFTTGTVPAGPGVPKAPPLGSLLFTDQFRDETIGSPNDPFTGEPIPNLKKFWFVGCIAYFDQFKQPHWTRFCMTSPDLGNVQMNQSTPLHPCNLYNDTDDSEHSGPPKK